MNSAPVARCSDFSIRGRQPESAKILIARRAPARWAINDFISMGEEYKDYMHERAVQHHSSAN